jgi:hypothetical protein
VRCMTVGIVSGSEEHLRHGLGTGSLVRWAGRSIVLTAEHVIRNTRPEDLGFFLRPNTPPKIVDRKTILEMRGVPTRELLPISTLGIRDIASDADLDLAALVVDGELDGRHPAARFHELMPGGVTPQAEITVISLGFPHDLMRMTNGNERVTFTYLEWSETVADREGLQEFDPCHSFSCDVWRTLSRSRSNRNEWIRQVGPKGSDTNSLAREHRYCWRHDRFLFQITSHQERSQRSG